MKAGLVGHPVSHSKSPLIHDYWMKRHGIKGSYNLIDTPPTHLELMIKRLIHEGYSGFNVTVPHKEAVLPLCDWVDDAAQEIGAVNTVQIKDGGILGYNTDAYGFIENLRVSGKILKFTDLTVMILGAGGAARAVIYGLKKQGVSKIYLTNRTKEKADILQNDFGGVVEVIDWKNRDKTLGYINLLVNTTSLGMVGKPKLKINLKGLNSHTIVNDIVYNPLETQLLQNSVAKGNRAVTGIGMLIHQAAPAFKLWSGIEPEITDELQDLVLS